MARVYRDFKRLCTAPCIMVVFLAVLCAPSASRAQGQAAFAVHGITVDISSVDAVSAREKAFAEAGRLGLRRLAERMMAPGSLGIFEVPEDTTIASMIDDFEIENEQFSETRYAAAFNFRFSPDAVRSYFTARGYAFSDVSSKPVLILPYYRFGSRTILWGYDNPWLQAWRGIDPSGGLVPVIVPIGDAADIADLSNTDALAYEPSSIASITARYGAGEAVILIATPSWPADYAPGSENDVEPESFDVTVYRTDLGKPEFVTQVSVSASDRASETETIYAAAARMSTGVLQDSWKARTAADAAAQRLLRARILFNAMPEWIETQRALRSAQGVRDVKLVNLSPREALVDIVFSGDDERLRSALFQSGLALAVQALAEPYGNPQGGWGATAAAYEIYMTRHAPSSDIGGAAYQAQ